MKTELFNYHLPKNLIAQSPTTPRDHSRLLVYDRATQKIEHEFFYNLKKFLRPDDVLVFNDSKVFPARLITHKPTGGKVEIFLLKKVTATTWQCLIGGKVKNIKELEIKKSGQKLICKLVEQIKPGKWLVEFNLSFTLMMIFLDQHGQTPIPPYIKVKDSKSLRQKYQTVYAKNIGSAAAPTAGLHFTKSLLNQLNKLGVQQEFVTLHVGLGTFAPVKSEKVEQHEIHQEWASIDKATCQRLNKAKKQGRRIIAVGTTSLRTLEALSLDSGKLKSDGKWVDIFIYPGYKFKFVDALITNFHLPCSSLLMLVSALLGQNKSKQFGVKKILDIYQQAIKKKYRFFSFGDAMFIE